MGVLWCVCETLDAHDDASGTARSGVRGIACEVLGTAPQGGLLMVAASQPCFPPHELLPQNHVAPRNPHIALLALSFSDTATPTTSEVSNWFNGPAVAAYFARVSGGCTSLQTTAFVASLSVTERDSGGSCRAVQKSSFESLVVPAVPGYVASSYYATIIIPVSTSCATSAVTGSGSLSIGGATVSFSNAIWMGFARNIHGSSSSTTADGEADGFAFSQRTFVHELWHLFGAGYHQNAHKCLSPGSDQTDVLACPSYEYGDKYEILGGSNGWASNTNARLRYHFGWLGASNITFITLRGTHSLAAINDETAAGVGAPRAAVFPASGLWLEWRSAMDTQASGSAALARNPGLFVRRWNTMIDADLSTCSDLTHNDWLSNELQRVTLLPGRTLVLRKLGLLVQANAAGASNGLLTLSAHFTGEAPACIRQLPSFDVGLWGEYRLLTPEATGDDATRRTAVRALPALSGYARTSTHQVNALKNRDPGACGSAAVGFTLSLGSALPSGWAFGASSVSIAPDSQARVTFGFGVPASAADGNYDFCLVGTSAGTGLRTAKLVRVTLPETGRNWWDNNRPASYSGADAALVASCAALAGCDPSVSGCVAPPTNNCDVSRACEGGLGPWGRCWKDGSSSSSSGVRIRGRDRCCVTQSFCLGGPPLLESQACTSTPLDPPCADQTTCRADASSWSELRSSTGASTMCAGTALCSSGGAGVGTSICNDVYGSGDLRWTHACGGGNNGGSVNVACLRTLIESSSLAGGYQLSATGSSAWIYGTGIVAATNTNSNYQCWAAPLGSSAPACACLGPGVSFFPAGACPAGYSGDAAYLGNCSSAAPPPATPAEQCVPPFIGEMVQPQSAADVTCAECEACSAYCPMCDAV